MHDYLRAVGFSHIKENADLEMLLHIVQTVPDHIHTEGTSRPGITYAEKSKDFAENAGITVRGEIGENQNFSCEYYFPHYLGRCISVNEDVTAQKRSDREDYDGICDLSGEGMSVIFHMNRLQDYAQTGRSSFEMTQEEGIVSRYIKHASIRFSALSISGKILIPMSRRRKAAPRKIITGLEQAMLAQSGVSQDMIDMQMMTMEQIDSYLEAVRRLEKEDILSVVDTYFMPCGISYDQYSILGDILDCSERVNQLTGELLVQMLVVCNGLVIDICMNRDDLLGEAKEGRRFMGTVWMQGIFEE